MNYQRIYDELIARGVARGTVAGYCERHHIVPRCLGGSNDRDNLVDLTAREHFIAHVLLAKVHSQENGLVYAAWFMSHDPQKQGVTVHSRVYEALRVRYAYVVSENMSGLAVQGLHPMQNPEVAARAVKAMIELNRRPEFRAKKSSLMKSFLEDPVTGPKFRANVRAAQRALAAQGLHSSQRPEYQASMRALFLSLGARGLHPMQQAETAAKVGRTKKALYADPVKGPALRAKISGANNPMKNPEVAAKHAEKMASKEYRLAMRTSCVAVCDAKYAASGKTRPVVTHPKAGTKNHAVWTLADEMTAELGYPVDSKTVQVLAVERSIASKNTAKDEMARWFRYHYIQSKQEASITTNLGNGLTHTHKPGHIVEPWMTWLNQPANDSTARVQA